MVSAMKLSFSARGDVVFMKFAWEIFTNEACCLGILAVAGIESIYSLVVRVCLMETMREDSCTVV